MEEEPVRIRWFAWPLAIAAAGGAVWLVLEFPGDLAFWVSPLLAFPLLVLIERRFLSPWQEVPKARRAAAWVVGGLLALSGAPLLTLDPSTQTWLIAALLTLPLVMVVIAWQEDDKSSPGAPLDPTLGTPDF